MAISDSPETIGITGTSTSPLTDSDLTHTLRRRPAAATTVPRDVPDSGSKTEENDSTLNDSKLNDLVRHSGSDDSVTAEICDGRTGGSEASMDSVNAVQDNKGLGENDRGVDPSAVKFAYRPSVPAHRRVKESPLSSDAIFRQSHAVQDHCEIGPFLCAVEASGGNDEEKVLIRSSDDSKDPAAS